MLDPKNLPPVDDDERLARFVMSSNQFRRSDRTIKAAAFKPPKTLKLSVTRHREASEAELWKIGAAIATGREKPLYGRVDVVAEWCRRYGLTVSAQPEMNNPNHVNLENWPQDPLEQKYITSELAKVASKLLEPPSSDPDRVP